MDFQERGNLPPVDFSSSEGSELNSSSSDIPSEGETILRERKRAKQSTLSLVKNLSRLNENRAKAHIAIENGFGRKGRFTPRRFYYKFLFVIAHAHLTKSLHIIDILVSIKFNSILFN